MSSLSGALLPPLAVCAPTGRLLGVRGLSHLLKRPPRHVPQQLLVTSPPTVHAFLVLHIPTNLSFASLWVLWGLGSSQRKVAKWCLTEALVRVSLS